MVTAIVVDPSQNIFFVCSLVEHTRVYDHLQRAMEGGESI